MNIEAEEMKWVIKDLKKILVDIENENTREIIQSTIDDLEINLERLKDKLEKETDKEDWDFYRDCLLEQQ